MKKNAEKKIRNESVPRAWRRRVYSRPGWSGK